MNERGRYLELLRRYVAPQWRSALGLIGLLLVTAAVQVAHPRLLATFVDAAADARPVSAMTRIAIAFIALACVGQVTSVLDSYVAQHVALVATNRLRTDLTLHCLTLDLSFHSAHRPGELIQRVDGDVANVANFLSRFLIVLAGNVVMLTGVLVMVTLVDWRLGLELAVFCMVIPLVAWKFRTFGRRYWERFLAAQADQAGFLEEHLSSTEDIRSSGATGYAMARLTEHARTVLGRHRQAAFFGNLVGSASGFAFGLGSVVVLGTAAGLFQRGEVSIGAVFLIFAYTQILSEPIQEVNRQLQDLQVASAAVGRIYELLQTSSTIVDGEGDDVPSGPLDVEVDGVTFRYEDDTELPVLHDVTLRLEPGRVLGLLGRTGSGKTTVARLLVRFHDPDAGAVRLGGVDLRETSLASVRRHVGLVTQEVHLFHASVRDNLTLFDADVEEGRILAVVAEVGLTPWLDGLARGLDTLLSAQSGMSAGEAQLLAFARVFLRDPGLVILDEATARLDPATEQRVETAISRLFEGRTAIVIAHRLRTVLRADEILLLEGGRIVEHGERAALAADPDSRFARLLAVGMEEALA